MLKNSNRAQLNPLSVSLLVSGVVFSVVAQLVFALPVRAECWYEGMRYETSERVGSSVCMPDGSWKAE
jgi:hypothetical protein